MRIRIAILITPIWLILFSSCGVSGDPGHCFISVDWEYYNREYGVYYYEDSNPNVPDFDHLDAGLYYDSYPGTYEYYYESEDVDNWYSYTGNYTLIQNTGKPGGLFHDGMDGVDTYFDLFLFIYAKKYLGIEKASGFDGDPFRGSKQQFRNAPQSVEKIEWEQSKGEWTIHFKEEVKTYKK